MIILDTNVLSEIMRPVPDAMVAMWLRRQNSSQVYLTSIIEAEIYAGIAEMPAGRRRLDLLHRANGLFDADFAGKIWSFDSDAARKYAEIIGEKRKAGQHINGFDGQIAAIARARGAAVATRNIRDFQNCGVSLINPWGAGE